MDGTCTLVPSEGEGKPNSASYQPRAYPAIEEYGIVWVWMGDAALASADRLPHFVFHGLDNPRWVSNFAIRDLEIDCGLMIENLLDPAHLPFTHEGTIAKRGEAQVCRAASQPQCLLRAFQRAPNSAKDWNRTHGIALSAPMSF